MISPPTCKLPFESLTFGDRLLWEVWLTSPSLPTLATADELGLFALLAEEAAGTSELAKRLELDPHATALLLSTLYSLGALVKRANRFLISDTGRKYLLPYSPFYCGSIFRLCEAVPRSLSLTGSTSWSEAPIDVDRGDHGWCSGRADEGDDALASARAASVFIHAHSFPETILVARRGEFREVGRLLDLAGGSGCFGVNVARCVSRLQCTVLELPVVCGITQECIAHLGVADRVAVRPCDVFTDRWPVGHDAVFFSNVFHDWSLDALPELIDRSFTYLPSGGRIYVHALLLNDQRGRPLAGSARMFSTSIANQAGRLTEREITRQFSEGGFVGTIVTPTNDYHSLLSAVKP